MRLALALCLALVSVSASAQATRIGGIRAALISDYDGSPQPIDFSDPDLWLFNRFIGDSPSHATLVIVDLTGAPGSFGEISVTLTARNAETGRRVSQQTGTVGGFSDRGRSTVVFVLQETACDALRVTATLGRATRGTEITLPFQCGE